MSSIQYVDVFPFSRLNTKIQVLLLRRGPHNTYPGIWQPVAGKLKPGERAWEAGLRELKEETGYEPSRFYALDHVSSYYLHQQDRVIHVPAFLAEVSPVDPVLSHEHDAFQWLSISEAVEHASWEPYRNALLSIPRLLDSSPALAQAKIL